MPDLRVRFAPSPTGPLHIGGLRTALINYLFARHHGGVFILRIEDTDRKRYQEGAETYILDALTWCGMVPDEGPFSGGPFGPYRQSDRKDIYAREIDKLISSGHAYYAFDTVDELDAMRKTFEEKGIQGAKYDATTRMEMRNSLTLSGDETRTLLESGAAYTIRLKIDPGREVIVDDLIRGRISFQSDILDDKVLIKADGMPTYHFANVVDDHMMKISHVIRGEEWLSSTAHHVLLYEALGWVDTTPGFAHLPLILKPTGKGKLSKRDGAKFGFPVYPLRWQGNGEDEVVGGFREAGFDPEALINFLAFLGWNPGTEQEIFHRDELIRAFSLDQVTRSGARFDYDKAKWFNSKYIQEKDDATLADILVSLYPERLKDRSPNFLKEFCALLKERVSLYPEFLEQGVFFFERPKAFVEKVVRKKWNPEIAAHFSHIAERLKTVSLFTAENLENVIKEYMTKEDLGFGALFPHLRNALSGTTQGPDLFRVMALLGKDECIARLYAGKEQFNQILQSNDKEKET